MGFYCCYWLFDGQKEDKSSFAAFSWKNDDGIKDFQMFSMKVVVVRQGTIQKKRQQVFVEFWENVVT